MACRRSLLKRDLLRLVRAPDGGLRVDPEARAEGRGAYLCAAPECAERAADGRALAHSFRAPVRVAEDTIELIREWQRSASTR